MGGERPCRLVPGTQVLGSRLAEPAQVDHLLDPLTLRHLREVAGRCLLAGTEVAVTSPPHRVDQVVGGVDPLAGAAQAVRVERVALMQLVAPRFEGLAARAVADQATDLVPVGTERFREPAADEPCRPGYQRLAAHALPFSRTSATPSARPKIAWRQVACARARRFPPSRGSSCRAG